MSDFTRWAHANDEILKIAGPYFSASILLITFLATITLTRSIKKTDTILQFGELFISIIEKRQELDRQAERLAGNGLPAITAPELMQRAKDYYAQFFSLMFTEYYAYSVGNLDRKTFTLWMNSRRREYAAGQRKNNSENIHGVTYREGWEYWYTRYHNHDDKFVRLMRKVHNGTNSTFVLVIRYGSRPRRLLWQLCFRPALWVWAHRARISFTILVASLIVTAAVIGFAFVGMLLKP